MTTPERTEANEGSKTKKRLLLVLLLLAIPLIWFLLSRQEDVPKASLEELLIQTRSELESPGLSVAEAADNLADADAVLAFVKEGIQYVSYAGRLQNPDTVMRTRVANVADRAMLLVALLEAKGVTAKAMVAPQWPTDAQPFQPTAQFKQPPTLEKLARKIGYDLDQWRDELTVQVQNLSAHADAIRAETVESKAVIEKMLGSKVEGNALIDPTKTENEWVWISLAQTSWMDPSFPDLDRPAESIAYAAKVPETRVAIKARSTGGAEVNLLQWSGELLGKDATLNFFPTLDTAARLRGSADPSDISSWFPLLKVGADALRGEPFAMDGTSLRQIESDLPFTVENDTITVPDPVPVTALAVNSVSTENWPRVDLAVKADTRGKPQWVAPHFTVRERGAPKAVRIDSTYSNPAPVIVVADVSGSMVHEGRFEMIRKIGDGLVSRLNAGQPLAIVTFGDGVRVKRLLSPFDPASGVEEATWQSAIGGNMDYAAAIDRALNIIDVDLEKGAAARIVLVTDGELSNPDSDSVRQLQQKISDRLGATDDVRVFPIGVGISDSSYLSKLAQDSGGAFFAINPNDDPTSLYNWLGNALSGQILLSYESDLQDAGTIADVSVEVASGPGPATGAFTVPEWDGSNPAAIEIEIQIGEKNFSRTVIDLGAEQAQSRLAGSYQVFATPGPYPAEVVAARYLDSWVAALHIAQGKQADGDPNRSLSFGHASLTKSHALMTRMSLENPTQPDYPLVYMNKSFFGKSDDGVYNLRSIDQLRTGNWSNMAQSKSDVLVAGLASASAESRLLPGAQSVNQKLLARVESLSNSSIKESNWLASELPTSFVEDEKNMVLASTSEPDALWLVNSATANVLPFDHSYHLISKGTNYAEIERTFDRIDKLYERIGYWGGGAVSGFGLPFSQPFAGLVGFLRTQNKMWCYATVMMGRVADAIESEEALLNRSVKAAQADAMSRCKMEFNPEDFGEEVIKQIAIEWAKAWASDVAAAGIQDYVAPAAAGTFGPYTGIQPDSTLGHAIRDAWAGPRGSAGGIGAFISSIFGGTVVGGTVDAFVKRSNTAPSPLPVTQNFHKAMAGAIELAR